MSKIAIFYHIFQFGNWREVLAEQIERLRHSELLDAASYLHIGVNGGNEPLLIDLNKEHVIRYNPLENLDGEMDTLTDLYNFCVNNLDYKVLYFHTKGVSLSLADFYSNAVAWRKYLERFNIDNWKKCCELLNTHDCVGTEWETDMFLGGNHFIAPCYAGTFWWATAQYISKLDPSYLFMNPWGEKSRRWQCEFWIGTGNPNYYNFYSSGKNKYYNSIIPEEYEQFM